MDETNMLLTRSGLSAKFTRLMNFEITKSKKAVLTSMCPIALLKLPWPVPPLRGGGQTRKSVDPRSKALKLKAGLAHMCPTQEGCKRD
jgi:hypothetical protein